MRCVLAILILVLAVIPAAAQDEIVDQTIRPQTFTYQGSRAEIPAVPTEIVDQRARTQTFSYVGSRAEITPPATELVDQFMQTTTFRYRGSRVVLNDGVESAYSTTVVDPDRPPFKTCLHGSNGLFAWTENVVLSFRNTSLKGFEGSIQSPSAVMYSMPPAPNPDQNAVRSVEIFYDPAATSDAVDSVFERIELYDGDKKIAQSGEGTPVGVIREAGRFAVNASGLLAEATGGPAGLTGTARVPTSTGGILVALRVRAVSNSRWGGGSLEDKVVISKVCVTWDAPRYVELAARLGAF